MKARCSYNVPYALIGLGLLLAGITVVEGLVYTFASPGIDISTIASVIATVPFLAILVIGGYWLAHSEIGADRFPRIGAWTILGLGFLGAFFTLIAFFTQDELLIQIGMVRWAVAAGAGAGALVGISEARAIDRAVTLTETRLRNTELQREKDRLDEFANVIAHDLRNPLAVVSGRLDLAREEYDDSNLERAASSLERMKQIIEETLTLAQRGSVIDEPAPVDVSELVDQSWQNVDTAKATLEVEDSLRISADGNRLQQLFENLFRNAVEHGGREITVRVGALHDGFYVEDDGSGVPEEDRDAVFDAGYSTSQAGTGFGLSIVKKIAEAHGWDVALTESESGGARFEVTGVTRVEPGDHEESVVMPNPE